MITSSSALKRKTKPNFFASSITTIANICQLSETEETIIMNAKENWTNNKTPLIDTIEPTLYARIKSKFSFKESGFYTFIVKSKRFKNTVSRTLSVSMQVRKSHPSQGNKYYEWILY